MTLLHFNAIFHWAALFFFGSLWGSFFYTLALRYVNDSYADDKIKALITFSKCPLCNVRVKPGYLIPIIGFFALRGKCNECGGRISILYLLFEILYGIIILIIFANYGINYYSILIFLIIGLSISISIIDIKKFIIPNGLVFVFLLLTIYPVILNNSIMENLYGFLLTSCFFIIILLLFPGSFGGGDLKFASSIGFLLGFQYSIVALEAALVTGSIIGVIYALKSRKGFRVKLPFAPFLTIGLFVSLLYGRDIVLIYYRCLL